MSFTYKRTHVFFERTFSSRKGTSVSHKQAREEYVMDASDSILITPVVASSAEDGNPSCLTLCNNKMVLESELPHKIVDSLF